MYFDTRADNAASSTFFFLRATPPTKKLLSAFIFSLATSMLASPLPAFGACSVALALIIFSGIQASYVARRLVSVNAFFLLLWLLLPLSFFPKETGAPLFAFGGTGFHISGVRLALLITLKGNAIVLALLALASSSTITENGHALLALRIPEKLVALLLITHSNLALMTREYKRLFQAARLRGFVPQTNMASYATHARLIALLLIRSWQHAQRVDQAMRLRGFCGRFPLIPSRCSCPVGVQIRNSQAGFLLLIFCGVSASALIAWDLAL